MTDPDKIMAETSAMLRECADMIDRLAAENAALRAAKRDHDLANGGCVPKPAYDELAAECAALRAAIERVEALANTWRVDLPTAEMRDRHTPITGTEEVWCPACSVEWPCDASLLLSALALPEGEP